MNMVMSSAGRWAVSARPTGELLVARCDAGDISVIRFGLEQSPAISSEDQLRDLVEASRAAAARKPSSGPISALLHQVLARLLASESVTNGGALIVIDDGQDVTVATTGDVVAHLVLDGAPAQLPWVRVRDRSGHEARAYPVPANRQSVFALNWPRERDPHSAGVEIEATWSMGTENAAPEQAPEMSAEQVHAEAPSSAEMLAHGGTDADHLEEGATEEKEGFLQWFDRMRGRRTQVSESATKSVPERIPPSPEPEWLTAAAVEPVAEKAQETLAAGSIQSEGLALETVFAQASNVVAETLVADAPASEIAPAALEIVASPEAPAASPPPMRPAWPEFDKVEKAPVWKRPWMIGLLVVALACGVVFAMNFASRPSPSAKPLVGLFGPRFSVTVNSRPAGAWISVDGKETGRLTPATLELSPGEHQVMLSIPDKGSVTHVVKGIRNERTSLDAALYGGVKVASADPRVPISVTLDGLDRGYVPISIEDLLPGPHEIRFRAPGMDPWTETFEVRVGETNELIARPFTIPDVGVIEIRATNAIEGRAEPLKGANIFIDGELRGTTPETLELPHGPHSIRVSHRGEDAPVQVIDLPGGNHRFANFALGTGIETPRIVQLSTPGSIARDQPTVLSAALSGVPEDELREMWLHVRSPERTWKRYEMTLLRTTGSVVGVVVFPPNMLDGNGAATYYMSAVMQVGDEFFTELRTPRRAEKPVRTAKAVRRTGNGRSTQERPPAVTPGVTPTPSPTPATGSDNPVTPTPSSTPATGSDSP